MYEHHLKEIQNSLYTYKNYLPTKTCDILLDYAKHNKNRFNDRTQFAPIYSLTGELGRYKSFAITHRILPALWSEHFAHLSINNIPPSEVQVNWYQDGEFIPPHKDKQYSLYTVTVPLQTSQNMLMFGNPEAYYNDIPIEESNKNGMTMSCPDIKLSLIHI